MSSKIEKMNPFDQAFPTARAYRVFRLAQNIADVNVEETLPFPDRIGFAQGSDWRSMSICVFVVGVETADMPGDFRIYIRDESGDFGQFLL